jgi:hypothetical protein
VTLNGKMIGGQLQDTPKKSRYNKGQLEALFGPGTRVTAPGKQKDQLTRTKMTAALDDSSNKKAQLEDKYTDEEKEGERRFDLKAMDTPLRGKGSSHIHEGKLTTTGAKKTTKKTWKKASFAEAASAPAPEVAKKPGFLYQKCIAGFATRVEKG